MSNKARPRRIELPDGETLILAEDFCSEVLANASLRTGSRYEAQGLPFIMIAGAKYNPLKAGGAWLAARITRLNQPQKSRALK